ncbi:MAG: hypothetical protein IT406_00205 [Candidatus Yanofskybacteria bacterium]|nr:hypothetical protein [Candidatus Yanofskybacteria bacterium]
MEKRMLFPLTMFLFAGVSFVFGGWQYFQARATHQASQQRMAFILTSIEESGVSRVQKQQLYARIMDGLPAAPSVFGIDVSGSFASPGSGDACTSEGQRTVCRALVVRGVSRDAQKAICGACYPSME